MRNLVEYLIQNLVYEKLCLIVRWIIVSGFVGESSCMRKWLLLAHPYFLPRVESRQLNFLLIVYMTALDQSIFGYHMTALVFTCCQKLVVNFWIKSFVVFTCNSSSLFKLQITGWCKCKSERKTTSILFFCSNFISRQIFIVIIFKKYLFNNSNSTNIKTNLKISI